MIKSSFISEIQTTNKGSVLAVCTFLIKKVCWTISLLVLRCVSDTLYLSVQYECSAKV